MTLDNGRREPPGTSSERALQGGQSAAAYAVATASEAATRVGNGQWRMHVQAPDWALRTQPEQQRHVRSRRVLSALLAGLAAVLAVLVLTISGTPAGTEEQRRAGGTVDATRDPLLTPDASATASPSAPPADASPQPTAAGTGTAAPPAGASPEPTATSTATPTASAEAELTETETETETEQSAAQQQPYDLELARVVALSVLALLAILSAVALLSPRRDPLVFSVTVGGVSESLPQTGAPGGSPTPTPTATATTTADGGGQASASGEKKDTSLAATEPVVTQALVTVLLLAAGVLGINTTEGLKEDLYNVALPLVPLLGAFFARSRVTPLPRTSPS